MKKTVQISCFSTDSCSFDDHAALVAIDVIRASTTATTAVHAGRRCFPVTSVHDAVELAARLTNPLMVGELGGLMPAGFDLHNSPFQLERHMDISRPVILLSSSGTQLMHSIMDKPSSYIASFRNLSATIDHLAGHHSSVVLIGAGTLNEFREEDQMCCSWIAQGLMASGFVSKDKSTSEMVERWRGAPMDGFMGSRSVDYLLRSGQEEDLKFILNHFDDVDSVLPLSGTEVLSLTLAGSV